MLALTLATIVATGDFFWIVLLYVTHFRASSVALSIFSGPLTLLALATFFGWVYLRREPEPEEAAVPRIVLSDAN